MDARTWLTLSIVGYSLAGTLFILTCILFFKMRILAIIGDLSGRTAAKQIQEIREQNAISGQKRYQPSAFNLERGSLTEPVNGRTGRRGLTGMRLNPKSKRLEERGQTGVTLNQKSRRLEEQGQTAMGLTQKPNRLEEQGQLNVRKEYKSSGTEVLGEWGTEVLYDEGTAVLIDEFEDLNQATEVLLDEETEVLTESYGTTVLHPTGELEKEETDEPVVEFRVVKDIKVIHTDEVI
jgi:hypothetical protein